MVTIYDLAKKTGFSVTTVSKALNNYKDVSEKTKNIILQSAKEAGYLPNSHARTLTTKRSWTIGVLFVEKLGLGITHAFFGSIIESFKKKIESEGYDLLFISKDIGNTNMTYLEHCKYRGIDGVIVVCSDFNDTEVDELINSSIPCVLIDQKTEHANCIFSENEKGSIIAVEYLHSLGHEKIAHIAGDFNTYAGLERMKGYMQAMNDNNLEIRESYIIDAGYFSIEEGYDAMNKLLEIDDIPTAVYVAGDYMAIGAIRAIEDKGYSVPKDISVIGFDDITLSKLVSPRLTTIKQNTKKIGEKAGSILIGEIDGESNKKSISVPIELLVRESCMEISK